MMSAPWRSIYIWNNTWPREAFTSDEAWEEHKTHVGGVWDKFNAHLNSVGDVTTFDTEEVEIHW